MHGFLLRIEMLIHTKTELTASALKHKMASLLLTNLRHPIESTRGNFATRLPMGRIQAATSVIRVVNRQIAPADDTRVWVFKLQRRLRLVFRPWQIVPSRFAICLCMQGPVPHSYCIPVHRGYDSVCNRFTLLIAITDGYSV